MRRPGVVRAIASWEFRRWFKLRSTITTLIISLVAALAFSGGRYWMQRQGEGRVEIAVSSPGELRISDSAGSRFRFEYVDGVSLDSLRGAVSAGRYDALLILRSLDEAKLVVVRAPSWLGDLRDRLDRDRRSRKMAELDLSDDQLADLMAPTDLEVTYASDATGPISLADKIAALLLLAMMLIGVFNSLGCQLVAITGEKQQRMTEQILSAISPQQWMDGKILGISLYAAAQTGVFVLSSILFLIVSSVFGQSLPVPLELGSPVVLAIMLAATAGGFLLWNIFFAAVASVVNDPNVSSKTGFMFLPVLITILPPLLILKTPVGTMARVLTLLPITSPSVLPARLVLAAVPWWESVAALVLLALAIWLARIAAARTFRIGMLMFGKEPTLKEVLRWIRER